jgi:diguanylate cyclase (GGDEF)-like protein/PAS domain S-box-containing protein
MLKHPQITDDLYQFVENLPGIVYRLEATADQNFYFSYISPLIEQWLDVSRQQLSHSADPLMSLIHPQDYEQLKQQMTAQTLINAPDRAVFRITNRTGQLIWIELYHRGSVDSNGSMHWLGYLNDITERKHLEARLAENEAWFRNIVENASDIIYTVTSDGELLYLSPVWHQQLGYAVDDSINRNIENFINPDDLPKCRDYIAQVFAGQKSSPSLEYRVRHANGYYQWHTSRGSLVTDSQGDCYFLGIARDITREHSARSEIEQLALYDQLTGLPNRTHFQQLVEQALRGVDMNAHSMALLYLDLDKFKPVNDTYGHSVGDELLKLVAQRLQQALRSNDKVCRVGGDEFILLIDLLVPGQEGLATTQAVAERIRASIERLFFVDGHALSVSASIGIAMYPDHAQQLGELIRTADQAMYRAKAEGRNCVRTA